MSSWVLLAYRLPREPSTPRIAIWRQLRRLGALQLADGLVALPLDARTREQLEWLADDVIEHDGEATIWVGQPGSASQERALATRMASSVAADYERIAVEALTLAAAEPVPSRSLGRLRRELRRTRARDYFPGPASGCAAAAVEALGRRLEAAS